MSLLDLMRAAAALSAAASVALPHVADALERQRRIDEIVAHVRRHRPLAHDFAPRIAVFAAGGWAQRYPVGAHDLGDAFAVYVADWLLGHATDTDGAMHDALAAWRAEQWLCPL